MSIPGSFIWSIADQLRLLADTDTSVTTLAVRR